ncbi:uncharacterized protein LOC115890255 [Sitophilus oryzae]|uniref:Uncharacterized protein LOC115890255 n=1 Tax=Sitophilus oryzae TaxID=7048 RepID=A0A6J2YSL0_SITOR|nr:uncharacterized protein LOC115890255 [Sitophilus oryzae]
MTIIGIYYLLILLTFKKMSVLEFWILLIGIYMITNNIYSFPVAQEEKENVSNISAILHNLRMLINSTTPEEEEELKGIVEQKGIVSLPCKSPLVSGHDGQCRTLVD